MLFLFRPVPSHIHNRRHRLPQEEDTEMNCVDYDNKSECSVNTSAKTAQDLLSRRIQVPSMESAVQLRRVPLVDE